MPGHLKAKKARNFDAALSQYLAENNIASGAHHVLFTPGSDKIIIVTVESRILVIDLRHSEQGTFEVLEEFGHHRGLNSEGNSIEGQEAASVITVAVSADGQWLATGDDMNRIHIFNLDNLKVSYPLLLLGMNTDIVCSIILNFRIHTIITQHSHSTRFDPTSYLLARQPMNSTFTMLSIND